MTSLCYLTMHEAFCHPVSHISSNGRHNDNKGCKDVSDLHSAKYVDVVEVVFCIKSVVSRPLPLCDVWVFPGPFRSRFVGQQS